MYCLFICYINYCWSQCMFSLVPFIIVHTNAALNDLLELWDFDFVETVRFHSLWKQPEKSFTSYHINRYQRRWFKQSKWSATMSSSLCIYPTAVNSHSHLHRMLKHNHLPLASMTFVSAVMSTPEKNTVMKMEKTQDGLLPPFHLSQTFKGFWTPDSWSFDAEFISRQKIFRQDYMKKGRFF